MLCEPCGDGGIVEISAKPHKILHLRRNCWPILEAHKCFFPVNKYLAKSLAGIVLYVSHHRTMLFDRGFLRDVILQLA